MKGVYDMKNKENLCDLTQNGMRERLCQKQDAARLKDGSKISDQYVADYLGELLDFRSQDHSSKARRNRYKNLKNGTTNQRYISRDAVRKLAELFGCSLHYLEFGPTENDDGTKIKSPIYSIDSEQWADLSSKLREDHTSIENLHFIFCQLPEDDSNEAIKALNTFLTQFKDNSFYSTSSKAIKKRRDLVVKILENDPFYAKSILQLTEAIDYINEGENIKALKKYIEIIIQKESEPGTELSALKRNAYEHIKGLTQSWNDFPDEIKKILPKLYDIYISPKKDLNPKAISKAKEIAENYLNSN